MKLLLTLSLISTSARAQSEYTLETVAEGLNFPWSIAFLPGGDYLVAMRSGEVRNISADGNVSEPITGLPESYVMSQGGYFDITIDPDFISNQRMPRLGQPGKLYGIEASYRYALEFSSDELQRLFGEPGKIRIMLRR